MIDSPMRFIALLLAAALNWYPKHEFLWERPTVSIGKGGSIIGRRIHVAVGGEQYDQETYLGMLFILMSLPTFTTHLLLLS
jgi:hypothetical protein